MAHYTTSFRNNEEAVFSPKTLKQLCTQVCASQVKSILFEQQRVGSSNLTLKPNLKVDPTTLDSILEECDHCDPEYVQVMTQICKNVMEGRLWLKRINLTNCQFLTDSQFEQIMKMKPTSLEMHNCLSLTDDAFDIINKYGENLESLNIGTTRVIYAKVNCWINAQNNGTKQWDLALGLLNTPNLRRLTIWGLYIFDDSDSDSELGSSPKRAKVEDTVADVNFLEWLTRRFISNLEHLDLSKSFDFKSLDFLLKAKDSLKYLCLDSVYYYADDHPIRWDVLTNLHNLTFLDVSFDLIGDKETGILKKIVESLPELTHLEVAGNKLRVSQVTDGSGRYRIDALACREQRPLEFVNLHMTDTSNCQLVPARVVLRDEDRLFWKLMFTIKAYKYYRRGKLAMAHCLEMISNQRQPNNSSSFPWKEAVNLVLEVIGPNQDYFYLEEAWSFNVINFLIKALKKPDRLTPSQVDQIYKYVLKVLNRNWKSSFELDGAIDVLSYLAQRMDLWNPTNAKILVGTLLRVATTAIQKYKAKGWTGEERDDSVGYLYILRSIGEHLCDHLTASTVSLIRTRDLEQKVIAIFRELMEQELKFGEDGLVGLYWKIYDKILNSKPRISGLSITIEQTITFGSNVSEIR